MFRRAPARSIIVLVAIVVAGTACSGGSQKTAPPVSTSTSPTTVVSTVTTARATTTVPTTVATTSVQPTVPQCASVPVPATPVTNPTASGAVLLTKVAVASDRCVDHVVFDFTGKTPAPPGYVIGYGSPPFSEDPSGKPVSVPGSGFIIVKVKPGYTYDYETGNPTYTGQTRIVPAGRNHVRAIVQTGDFEAVLTWVIGTNGKRPFTVQATGTPRHQLVINIS